MGSDKDIVYSYAARDLRRSYPISDGWRIDRLLSNDGICPDFIISRKWRGISQYMLASVCMKTRIASDDLTPLLTYEPTDMSGLQAGTAVIVPRGADVSAVPGSMNVVELRGFSCEGNEIVWWKKPVLVEKEEQY